MADLSAYSSADIQSAAQAAKAAGDNAAATTFLRELQRRDLEAQAAAAAERPSGVGEVSADIAKATGGGVLRGATGTVEAAGRALPAMDEAGRRLARWMMENILGVGPEDMPTIPGLKRAAEATASAMQSTGLMREDGGKTLTEAVRGAVGDIYDYRGQTLPARILGNVGEFMGGAAAIPVGGGLATRIGSSIIPGLLSGTAGEIAAGTPYETAARIGGAVAFPLAQAGAAPFLRRAAIGPAEEVMARVPGSTRQQSADLLEEAGVTVKPGQRLGAPTLQAYEGSVAPSLSQNVQLTRAALKNAGIADDVLATPNVLDDTHRRLGAIFDEADAAVTLAPSNSEAAKMSMALNEAAADAKIGDIVPSLQEIVDRFVDASGRGLKMSADDVGRLRTDLNRKLRLYAAQNDQINFNLAYNIKETLDDMVQRQIKATNPSLAGELDRARSQYRALLTIERAVNRSGADAANGIITPSALNSALRVREGGAYLRGIGTDLADLGKASAQVLSPAPTVLPGGIRGTEFPGLLQRAVEMAPRITARARGDRLALPAGQDILGSLLERNLRLSGGLLAQQD